MHGGGGLRGEPARSSYGGYGGGAIHAPAAADVKEGNEVPLIELVNVKKAFGTKRVLNGVSFKVMKGEAIGVIGPSGTGKSTVLKIMAGLLEPDSGEVYIRGKKVEGLLADTMKQGNAKGQGSGSAVGGGTGLRIGLVFQSAALFDSLTVRENVGFLLYEHSDLPQKVIDGLVTEVLLKVGLRGVEDKMPSQLSGGMKKRVALARAIISENKATGPDGEREEEVIMFDEPTAGLDPIASTVVEDLIRSTPDAGSVESYIVVTHQHSTIRRAVDRLIFLHQGRVVWEGTSKQFDSTDEEIVKQFANGALDGPIQYL